jgi:pullulanase
MVSNKRKNSRYKFSFTLIFPIFIILFTFISLTVMVSAQTDSTASTPNPGSVTVAGSFQKALGCDDDWLPECELTQLTYDSDNDVWSGTFDLPAGDYEYKAALNNAWDENYGLESTLSGDNIPLSLAEDSSVQFFYDHKTHWITDNVNSVIPTAIGDFQSELGCAEDGDAACLRSWLQDEDNNGIYSLTTTAIPAGDYEVRVALNQDASLSYGKGGQADGDPVTFTVPEDGFEVTFG